MVYKLINEDNTLVKDYPSPEIYKTISDEEKNNIFLFKDEIERIIVPKGLGKITVNVSYDGPCLEKNFMIKYSKEFSEEYYEDEIVKIIEHMFYFSKKNNCYDFYQLCNFFLGE